MKKANPKHAFRPRSPLFGWAVSPTSQIQRARPVKMETPEADKKLAVATAITIALTVTKACTIDDAIARAKTIAEHLVAWSQDR